MISMAGQTFVPTRARGKRGSTARTTHTTNLDMDAWLNFDFRATITEYEYPAGARVCVSLSLALQLVCEYSVPAASLEPGTIIKWRAMVQERRPSASFGQFSRPLPVWTRRRLFNLPPVSGVWYGRELDTLSCGGWPIECSVSRSHARQA